MNFEKKKRKGKNITVAAQRSTNTKRTKCDGVELFRVAQKCSKKKPKVIDSEEENETHTHSERKIWKENKCDCCNKAIGMLLQNECASLSIFLFHFHKSYVRFAGVNRDLF